jgi:hypothetical protein
MFELNVPHGLSSAVFHDSQITDDPVVFCNIDLSDSVQFTFSYLPVLEFAFTSLADPGDFNGDGVLSLVDIDDLTRHSANGTNSAPFDLNADALVDDADINVWIKDLFRSWVGDADLNGEFNSSDLVAVLASGTYEVDIESLWSSGDFNGDGRTDSSDLVAALADGGYELGPRAAIIAVPEPCGGMLAVIGMLWLAPMGSGCRQAGRRLCRPWGTP